MTRWSWLIALAVLGCKNPAKGLGDAVEDDAVLADTPELMHLADALTDPGATVLDLFDDDLQFDSAPDPSLLFEAMHQDHLTLDDGASERSLSVLTWNLGLLKRTYLFFKVEVPYLEERLAHQIDVLFERDHDILLLQEVWEVDDAEALAVAAEDAGYRVFVPGRESRKLQRETGLMIAVKDDLIGSELDQQGVQYQAQWKSENFPGPNLKRGWLEWSFVLADSDVEVHLFDTHLTPFYTEWQTRNLQVRELGLAMADTPDDAIVLLGGDFNAGWHYPVDVWVDAEDEEHEGWFRNASMPPLLAYYGGLSDLANLAELQQDPAAGDQIPTDTSEAWLDEAFGDASVCDGLHPYTATDCNRLYRENYGATELPARMDLLFLRDGTGRVRAREARRTFVEPIELEAGMYEPSDHYGQEVVLDLLE